MSQLTESHNVPLIEFLAKLGYNWWVGGLVINKDTEIFNNIFNDIFNETK